jgi:two-component sensor histidine kinase
LQGPNLLLEPNIAQAVSMTLHELATNAAKYGALSVPGGEVRVNWDVADGKVTIRWDEHGGPLVREPTKRGFGTRVMDSMVRGQFKGAIAFDWRPAGLLCSFTLPVL